MPGSTTSRASGFSRNLNGDFQVDFAAPVMAASVDGQSGVEAFRGFRGVPFGVNFNVSDVEGDAFHGMGAPIISNRLGTPAQAEEAAASFNRPKREEG